MSILLKLKEINKNIKNSKLGTTYYNYYLNLLEQTLEQSNEELTAEINNFIDDIRNNLDMLDLENNVDFFNQNISDFIDSIKILNTENYTLQEIKFSAYVNFENSSFNSEKQYLESNYFQEFIKNFI